MSFEVAKPRKSEHIHQHGYKALRWMEDLAVNAAEPTEAGEKMRHNYYALIKLTNRQLTVDILRKLCERKVGVREVESMARKVIKGEEHRRNPKIVVEIMNMKLKHAEEQVVKTRKLL